MSRAPLVVLLHGVQSASSTFWRVGADLRDLGSEVIALDLPGHGARRVAGDLDLAALAADVGRQLDERVPGRPVDLLVGHSLGGLTALTLAAAQPERILAVLAEDPPALGPDLDPRDVAAAVEHAAARAQADPAALAAEYRSQNPLWGDQDVRNAVANLQALDAGSVTAFLRRAADWDLVALVRDCPVPVTVILARGAASALGEPARTQILDHLSPDHVVEVDSGHSVHRDRPGLWVGAVQTRIIARATP